MIIVLLLMKITDSREPIFFVHTRPFVFTQTWTMNDETVDLICSEVHTFTKSSDTAADGVNKMARFTFSIPTDLQLLHSRMSSKSEHVSKIYYISFTNVGFYRIWILDNLIRKTGSRYLGGNNCFHQIKKLKKDASPNWINL